MLVPKSIDPTGSRDVTAELNALLASLAHHTLLDFPEGGRYRCEDVVKLEAKGGVTLNFNGALLFATTRGYRTRSHLRVSGCQEITLNRLKVRGANPYSGLDAEAYNPETEAQHGVEILQCSGVKVDHPEIRSVFGDFVYIGRKNPRVAWSDDIEIAGLYGRDNGRIGVVVNAASRVRVHDYDLARLRRSVFDIEPDSKSDGARDVVFGKGVVGSCHTGYLLASMGNSGPVEDITVRDVVGKGHAITCRVLSPEGTRCKRNISFIDCTSNDRVERVPLRFTRVDGVTVRNIDQPRLRVPLVEANDCTGVTIQ